MADAIGVSASQDGPPEGTVLVDLPALPGTPEDSLRLGSVRATGWLPVGDDDQGDAAVVELTAALGTEGAPLARLSRPEDTHGRMVRVFGYPRHIDHGVWAQAQMAGTGGPGGQWVQLDGVAVQGRRVERGFSGSGVIDAATGRVVGIVVAEDQLESAKVAWMLPLEVLGDVWPQLRRVPELRAAPGYRREGSGASRAVSTTASLVTILSAILLAVVVATGVILWPPGDGAATASGRTGSNAAGSVASSEPIQATAAWCSGGAPCFYWDTTGPWYWPSGQAGLASALPRRDSLGSVPDVVRARQGVIDVTAQTESNESVFVTGLQVIVRKRAANPVHGLIAYQECGGCGAQVTVRYFKTNLDDTVPRLAPLYGRKTAADDFPYQVSLVDPEYFSLVLADTGCDCTFDLRLDWIAGGKPGQTLLNNGGKHFRMVGTSGLPTYHVALPGFGEVPEGGKPRLLPGPIPSATTGKG